MFGVTHPDIPLEYRLDRLESEVFHQTNPEWDTPHRVERLQQTLLGNQQNGASSAPYPPGYGTDPRQQAAFGGLPAPPGQSLAPLPPMRPTMGAPRQPERTYDSPEYSKQLSRGQLEQFALTRINDDRSQQGLDAVTWDDTAYKIAKELVVDLCKRNTISHLSAKLENPDVRYTKSGGADAIFESLTGIKTPTKPTPNKAMVAKMIDQLEQQQDDRDSLMSPHATQFAYYFDWSADKSKLIGAAEVITRHSTVNDLPKEISVGDKLEVKGLITPPYKFQKITIAWEGFPQDAGNDSEDSDEALPYFPPLDYEAFARKSEHDWQKGTRLLQIGGIGLALAGGLFIPPVALAAPLIAATGSNVKPKAVSEIPVKGGVKVDGAMFEDKIQVSNGSKEGIYYITVWANRDSDGNPVAVSRRAVLAHGSGITDSKEEEKPAKKKKKADNGSKQK
jgi:uncharacterized protein YkwD